MIPRTDFLLYFSSTLYTRTLDLSKNMIKLYFEYSIISGEIAVSDEAATLYHGDTFCMSLTTVENVGLLINGQDYPYCVCEENTDLFIESMTQVNTY